MLFNGNLRIESFGGGADGRTDVWTDIWKFTPVSFRTSALWGRCPKSTETDKKKTDSFISRPPCEIDENGSLLPPLLGQIAKGILFFLIHSRPIANEERFFPFHFWPNHEMRAVSFQSTKGRFGLECYSYKL